MNYTTVLNQVISIVNRAGNRLIAEWQRPDGPRGFYDKADVDTEIECELRPALLDLLACDFWGEETGSKLTGNQHCWVVDPNDGTADFLKGLKGSAISVGLLSKGRPVLGVVYAPVRAAGGPDCIAWAEGMKTIYRNGAQLASSLATASLTPESRVMVSSAASRKPAINAELCAPATPAPTTSIAYRLAAVAAGDAVAGVSLVTTAAHDVLAGHAILRGAGGVLLDQDGQEITYGSRSSLAVTSRRCFGGALDACRELANRNWDRVFQKNV